jgi:hypothetical protein
MEQGELFEQPTPQEPDATPEPKKLARASDPSTSKAAAIYVLQFSNTHHKKILAALGGNREGTFYEVASWCDLPPSAVWRRLNELERKGWIETTGAERPGPTGRLCRVWRRRS